MSKLTNITTPTTKAAPSPLAPQRAGAALQDRVARVIDLIRPAVQADGGDIEFVGLTPENVARIRLHGACVGCPSSAITLQMGIERNLRAHVPEIKGIEHVD